MPPLSPLLAPRAAAAMVSMATPDCSCKHRLNSSAAAWGVVVGAARRASCSASFKATPRPSTGCVGAVAPAAAAPRRTRCVAACTLAEVNSASGVPTPAAPHRSSTKALQSLTHVCMWGQVRTVLPLLQHGGEPCPTTRYRCVSLWLATAATADSSTDHRDSPVASPSFSTSAASVCADTVPPIAAAPGADVDKVPPCDAL